jgi:glycerate-2-kinase
MTEDALAIVREAIRAVDPVVAIKRHVKVYKDELHIVDEHHDHEKEVNYCETTVLKMQDYSNVLLFAFGKASSAMAATCIQQLQMLPSCPSIEGVVIVKDDHGTPQELQALQDAGIFVQTASHPVPDERSVEGAKRIMELAWKHASSDTLVLCCISGGGSSLFCHPIPPLTLDDLIQTNKVLLSSGLDIQDMNVIRKRLETGKGGKLLKACGDAEVVTLILSDIIGDPLDLIASGPTVRDTSTAQDAWNLVETTNILLQELPTSVLEVLKQVKENPSETSDSSDPPLTFLVGNNQMALGAAMKKAMQLGYFAVHSARSPFNEEAKTVGEMHVAMAQHLRNSPPEENKMGLEYYALIRGGESTVSLGSNPGKGGRNQEVALSAALSMYTLRLRDVVLASVGTDGTDGPTDAAGAIVDGGTVMRLKGNADLALRTHDAYPYFDQVEADGHSPLIKTGPTGTNVADICVALIHGGDQD